MVYFEPSDYLYIKDKKLVFNIGVDQTNFAKYCDNGKDFAIGLSFYAKKRVYFTRKGGKSFVKLADPKPTTGTSGGFWGVFKWILIILAVLVVVLGVAGAVYFFIRSKNAGDIEYNASYKSGSHDI